MAKTLDVFQTTTGTKVKKVEASDGRIMRFADGTPITSQSYGAYKSHTPASEKFSRGNLENIEDTENLGFPFDSRTFRTVEAEKPGTEARKKIQRNNQWVGFLASKDTPDDPFEAAEQYQEMVSRLTGIENEDKRREIKEDYNIGGS